MLARSISTGLAADVIAARAASLFVAPTAELVDTLLELATSEADAGQRIKISGRNDPNWLANLPTNPHLFGDESDGDRVIIGVEFQDESGKSIIFVPIRDTGKRTAAEMIALAAAKATDIMGDYPRNFGQHTADDIDVDQIDILYGSRRF